MENREDGPEQPPAPKGAAAPSGWYSDPIGGSGLRWWNGSRWTEHRVVARTWGLADVVFLVEFGLGLCALILSPFSLFASDACAPGSDRCYETVDHAWRWMMVVQALLLAGCGVAFWRSKRPAVKLAAALLLAVGIVTTWVVAVGMISAALNLPGTR